MKASLKEMLAPITLVTQLDLLTYRKEGAACEYNVCLLPKQIDEQALTMHLPALGGMLNLFADEHAGRIVVMLEGLSSLEIEVCILATQPDEQVATLHLPILSTRLTVSAYAVVAESPGTAVAATETAAPLHCKCELCETSYAFCCGVDRRTVCSPSRRGLMRRPVSTRHQLQCREQIHLPSAPRVPIYLVATLVSLVDAVLIGANVEGLSRTEHQRCRVLRFSRECPHARGMVIVDILSPQKIVPSSPFVTVRLCGLEVDCRHQPSSFPLDVVFLHDNWCCRSVIC